MSWKKLAWIAAGIALVAVVVAVRIDRGNAQEEAPLVMEPPAAVRTAVVEWGEVRDSLDVQGVVEAAHRTNLSAEVGGRVVERPVRPGDDVVAGELLVRLEPTQLASELGARRADLSAAEAQAEAAVREREVQEAKTGRDRVLHEGGAISREAFELSEAALARARAGERSAREAVQRAAEGVVGARDRLADTEIRAPWDGVVVEVAVDPGDLAAPGTPVVRLVRDGAYRVAVRVPQEVAMELVSDAPVTVRAGGRSLEAAVSRIGGGLDPRGLAIVEIDVPNRPLGRADGASVRVTLTVARREGLTVPGLALLEGSDGATVFRIERRRAPEESAAGGGEEQGSGSGDPLYLADAVPVEVLLRGSRRVAVEGALSAGDLVVVEHPSVLMRLSDGMPVRPVEEGSGPRDGGVA